MISADLPRRAALAAWALSTSAAFSSHLIGGEIEVYFVAGDQYEVQLTLWRDCSGISVNAYQQIQYTSPCGSGALILSLVGGAEVSTLCALDLPNSTCNGGVMPGVERHIYGGVISLPPCNAWHFKWSTCCLNPSFTNVAGSLDMVVRAELNNLDQPCRSSIRFEQPALPYINADTSFSFDMLGLVDGPGIPRYRFATLVDTNEVPLTYIPPFSAEMPYMDITIDSLNGRIAAPSFGVAGQYLMSVRGSVLDSTGTVLSWIERVFGMVSLPGDNAAPDATSGAVQLLSGAAVVTNDRSLELWPGESFCFEALYNDPNGPDVLTVTSDINSILPGATFSMTAGNPATGNYCWTAPLGATGTHRFLARVVDGNCPIEGQQLYLYTVRILPDPVNPCSLVGMEDQAMSGTGLTVFPNPATDLLQWRVPSRSEVRTIELLDLDGHLLTTSPMNGTTEGLLDLPAGLSSGAYIVRYGADHQRVIVMH